MCDKTDQIITDDLKLKAIKIHGTNDLQDVETTDCDGKKTLLQKNSMENFSAELKIDPPDGLGAPVSFVEVKNARTCSERRVQVKSDVVSTSGSGDPLKLGELDKNGTVTIGLSNKWIRNLLGLNVAKGSNLVTVVYYGKCLDEKPTAHCVKGEELARKVVLVDVTIEDKQLNGIKSINTCTKKK